MDKSNKKTFNPDEIQICKPFNAVNSRIDNFLKRKRDETLDRNTRMYCSPITSRSYSSASRTCVTVEAKRRKGSECFVKTTRVHNDSGPLCNGGFDPASLNSYNLSASMSYVGSNSDVHERISNLETCLNIKSDGRTIYDKLKSIEDHVLKLENILLNINENYSLSNTFSTDQDTGIIRHNLKNDDLITQKKLASEVNLKSKNMGSEILSRKSKYSVNDIQELINSIKKKY